MYVSLHNQTEYSILDSLCSPKELFAKAKELNMPAIAITEHSSFASLYECYKESKKTGVKLIVGCEYNYTESKSDKYSHIILLAKNIDGFQNMLELNFQAYENGIEGSKKIHPVVNFDLLEKYSNGVICLTACGNGILSTPIMAKDKTLTKQRLDKLKSIYKDDLYIEIQANNLKRFENGFLNAIDQQFINRQLIKLANDNNVKIIPSSNTHYVESKDHSTHDALLSIGSHQNIYSNYRLKYELNDFYLKSEDEIFSFFSRNYGEDFAKQIILNTLEVNNKCENPEWIYPKYTNPSGKELPSFNCKEEEDYEEFKQWLSNKDDKVKSEKEDRQFIRFRVEKLSKQKFKNVSEENIPKYLERIEKDLDVFDYCDVSSYMLIVADYIDFCRKNNIPIGPGRGCLTGKTNVLTSNGFKFLKDVDINDMVYTHTGTLQKVTNKLVFDIDKSKEKLLKIKTNYSFDEISMTKDHKVYAAKSVETKIYKNAKTQISKNSVRRYEKFAEPSWIKACDLSKNDVIYTTFPKRNNIFVPKIKIGQNEFDVNNDIAYLIGRFVGDGWYKAKPSGYAMGIAFNSKDKSGIDRISNILKYLGFNPSPVKHKTKNLIQLMVYRKDLALMFKDILPDYFSTSNTKHFPIWFRNLPDDILQSLILGYQDSDGHVENKTNKICFDSTSKRLILEAKEALLYLKKPSSIITRKEYYIGEYKYKESYKLKVGNLKCDENGYYSKILDISEDEDDFVYDITVENDHSYLTSNYVVHNSAGGSIVAWILGIHNADPIKYDLVLERFHNKQKKAVSDIDADFSQKDRKKVIEYISNKYGKENVAHVSNLIKLTPKVYARDITRSFDLGGSQEESVQLGDKIADSMSADIHSIDQALNESPIFIEYCKKYPQLKDLKSICNKPRAFGTHAAGIIIGNRKLSRIAPLRKDKDGQVALEMDKELAEENGLIKMDILGVSTLDIISKTKELIRANGKQVPEIDVEAYDKKTYDLISSGNTLCVFQFGTSVGTTELCKKFLPKSIEDLSAINTLARPASKDIREDYILTKFGHKPPELLHPSLKNALEKTYCFPLYDEQLLILANDVAGWDLAEADKLRKLTKEKGKNPEKVKKWEAEFIEGAVKNGLLEEDAKKIWDKIIVPYGKYSFNKSHSILYSMISYETAYLKAHYPIEFLMANLMQELESNAPGAEENIVKIKQEIRMHGVKILPPDINKSSLDYVLDSQNNLITGLKGIKFVGDDAVVDIINKKPFKSFKDFMGRIDSSKVRSNAIQALAASGALDCFGLTRKNIWKYCSDYRKTLTNWTKKHSLDEEFNYKFEDEKDEWSISELYALELKFIGEGFICKPSLAYNNFFQKQYVLINQIKKLENKTKIKSFKFIVKEFVELTIKKETSKFFGQTMVKVIGEDSTRNTISITIFPDRWENLKNKLKKQKLEFDNAIALHISATVNIYEDQVGLIYDDIYELESAPKEPSDCKEKKKANNKKEKSNSLQEEIEQELFEKNKIELDN